MSEPLTRSRTVLVTSTSPGPGRPPAPAAPPPLTGHALERVTTAVGEVDVRAVDEIAHRARDEHLARPCQRGNPGADVHRDAREIVAPQLAFTAVDPGPH